METIVELSCVEAWREISELIDGTLDPVMQRRMEHHLRGCSHCRAVYNGAGNLVRLLGDAEVFELPLGFGDRLFRRLQADFAGA